MEDKVLAFKIVQEGFIVLNPQMKIKFIDTNVLKDFSVQKKLQKLESLFKDVLLNIIVLEELLNIYLIKKVNIYIIMQ